MTQAAPGIRIVPANECRWDDLQTILADEGQGCQCQFFKLTDSEWRGSVDVAERARRLRAQSHCGVAGATATSGLVGYLDGQPAGWCAVEPRVAYPRLFRMRLPWTGRTEDRDDPGIWAVTCFVVRRGYRRRGIAVALAAAAADFARKRGASAVEGYPRIERTAEEAFPAYLYVGSRGLFAAAGYQEVSRPTTRRVVMRIDF